MAASNSLLQSEAFTCKICFQPYNLDTRAPRVLPLCQHTICTECVRLISGRASGTPGNLTSSNVGSPSTYIVECPFDRKPHAVPMGDDVPFSKNFALLEALEAVMAFKTPPPPTPSPKPAASSPSSATGAAYSSTSISVEKVTNLVTEANFSDPTLVWIFPDLGSRKNSLNWFYGVSAEVALKHWAVYLTYESDGTTLTGVSVWRPPGKYFPLFGTGLSKAPLKIGLGASARLREIHTLHNNYRDAAMGTTAHWYLYWLAVRPDLQSNVTIWENLLMPGLQVADKEGSPVYADSTTAAKTKFLESHGFIVVSVSRERVYPQFWSLRHDPKLVRLECIDRQPLPNSSNISSSSFSSFSASSPSSSTSTSTSPSTPTSTATSTFSPSAPPLPLPPTPSTSTATDSAQTTPEQIPALPPPPSSNNRPTASAPPLKSSASLDLLL
ncbi:hypothetical protein Pelo_8638 [Pelomyxa schiedti]|nr:hypothetical protein Pelo_8638 [Pelomyxa schiedti]